MPTSPQPKRRPAPRRESPTRPPAKRPAKPPAPARQPFLRFYHSESLRATSLEVLATVEHAPEPTQYRGSLADLVVKLTEAGMGYYFLRPLKLAKSGFIVEQAASLGVTGAVRVMATVVRNIVGRMDEAQLLSVCSFIRQLMR